MQKLFKLFIFLISFFIVTSSVYAKNVNIKLGEAIPDINLHLDVNGDGGRTKQIFQIYNADTNELLYCIEPGTMLYDGDYEEFKSITEFTSDLSKEQMEMINKIAYFGYLFDDAKSNLKWYAITQFTIWDYILKERGIGEVYFIDENGKETTEFDDDVADLYFLAETAGIYPSFIEELSQGMNYAEFGESVTYTDENNVLRKFRIVPDKEIKVSTNGNDITFTYTKPGDYGVIFYNDTKWITPVRLYYKGGSQTVFGRGVVYNTNCYFTIHVNRPSLTIKKTENIKTSLSLANAKFDIYTEDGRFYTSGLTNEEGILKIPQIDLGNYYMIETEAPYGFLLNPEKIYFTVEGNTELEVENIAIEKRIDFEKYLEDYDLLYNLEPDTEFALYDNKTQELVAQFKTNELGKYTLKLTYGTYTLKQLSSKEGYLNIEDLEFTVDDNTLDGENIVLKNKQIVGSLTLYKIDSLTEELILEPAKFQIRNKKTGEYLKRNGLDVFATTDGILNITNIPYGDYEIIEIEAPFNYRLNSEKISFSIVNLNDTIELAIPNEKMTGSLLIKKVDAQTGEAIPNVVFGLYNKDKELIGEYLTDEEGLITIDNLEIGTYYLKELEPAFDYEELTEEIEIKIKDNIETIVTVNNRHLIKVPKTGINELLTTIIISSAILGIGLIICNHGKNN